MGFKDLRLEKGEAARKTAPRDAERCNRDGRAPHTERGASVGRDAQHNTRDAYAPPNHVRRS